MRCRRCWRRLMISTAASKCPASTTTWCRSPIASGKQFASLAVRRSGVHEATRRRAVAGEEGYHDARTPLGPADVRHQRPVERLSRRRGEDGAARPGQREVQLPPGAESGSEENRRGARNANCGSFARRASRWNWSTFTARPGVVVPLDSPYMAAAAEAIEHGFGRAPVFIREGGSIPIVNDFPRATGRRYAAAGLGPGRRQHAQPQRKILPGRLPPRHQSQCAPVGRIGEIESEMNSAQRHKDRRVMTMRFQDPSQLCVPLHAVNTASRFEDKLMLDRKFIVENADLVKQNCAPRREGRRRPVR